MGCGRRAPKADLRRFVAEAGRLVADPAARRPGRGAYLCRSRACWEQAVRQRGFARTLRQSVTVAPEIVESE